MMVKKERTDFCTMCRKNTEYILQKRNIKKSIKGKEYNFSITVAVCNECGEEISIPGLIDKNIHEVDAQYRAYEGLVSIDDIEKLMKIYKIGKGPLSLALGFWGSDDNKVSFWPDTIERIFRYYKNGSVFSNLYEREASGE